MSLPGTPGRQDVPVRLLADENFDNRIVRALRFRCPDVDITRVQDSAVAGADDESVLEWAATQHRAILTHDVATMIGFAQARVRAHLPMPGLVVVPLHSNIATVIADLALIADAATMADLNGVIAFVPLR